MRALEVAPGASGAVRTWSCACAGAEACGCEGGVAGDASEASGRADPASVAWLDQRFRLYRALYGDGRRLLWERVRASGPERRLERREGEGTVTHIRRWDSERTTGSPLVNFTDEEGPSPFDPERPFLLPGWRVERVSGSRPLPGGGTEMFQRIWAVPDRGPPPGDLPGVLVEQAADKVTKGVRLDGEHVRVAIRLRDREPLPALPSRSPGALAWEEGGRTSPRADRRRAVLAHVHARREVWIAELVAVIRAFGGEVHGWTVVVGPVVQATVPTGLVARLAAREDVERIAPDAGDPPRGDGVFLASAGCTGPAPAWLSAVDSNSCAPRASDGADAEYMDSVNLATGADAYLDRGYNGGNVSGGLAEWGQVGAWSSQRTGASLVGVISTLGLVVLDGNFWPRHPAFLDIRGGDRVRAYLDDHGVATSRVGAVSAGDPWGHGTRVAGIAMGDVAGGQDPDLPDDAARAARSGLAGGVAGVFSDTQNVRDTADALIRGALWSLTQGGLVAGAGGADVLTTSLTFHSLDRCKSGCNACCQTDDELLGLDADSLAVNALFHDGTVTFKSAGNTGGCAAEALTAYCGYPWQEMTPNGAAACISVGAGDTNAGQSWYLAPPVAMQQNEETWRGSAGSFTPDGRVHPLLTALAGVCGAPSPPNREIAEGARGWRDAPWHTYTYGDMGATSGATPRAAGAALLFKHWALETLGAVANTPGWLAVNLLHFANGVAWSSVDATGARVATPAPAYGLGKLRMRLYEGHGEGSGWGYQTWEVSAYTGSVAVLDLGEIPDDVTRIRVTAWWLEVNTDVGEPKAHLAMHLVSAGGGGFWGGTTTVETSTDRVLRIDLDCTDAAFGAPAGGHTSLVLQGIDVPTERRDALRNYRDVYVAVYWESGADRSAISCGTPRLCGARERAGGTESERRAPPPPSAAACASLRRTLEGQLQVLAETTRSPLPVRAGASMEEPRC